LTLDSTLSWKPHFQVLLKKVERSSWLITRIIHAESNPSTPCIVNLVRAVIYAQIAYAFPLWRPTETMFRRLQKELLRPIRLSLYLPVSAPVAAVFAETGLPSLRLYRQYLQIKLTDRLFSITNLDHPARKLFAQKYCCPPLHRRTNPKSTPIPYELYRLDREWHIAHSSPSGTRSPRLQRSALKQQMDASWKLSPSQSNTCRYLFHTLHEFTASHLRIYLLHDNKHTAALRCRMRLRRANLQANLFAQSRSESRKCPHCDHRIHSNKHVIEDCPTLDAARQMLQNQLDSLQTPIPITITERLVLAIIPPACKKYTSEIIQYTGQFIRKIHSIHQL
jgi:hypothetical protein